MSEGTHSSKHIPGNTAVPMGLLLHIGGVTQNTNSALPDCSGDNNELQALMLGSGGFPYNIQMMVMAFEL